MIYEPISLADKIIDLEGMSSSIGELEGVDCDFDFISHEDLTHSDSSKISKMNKLLNDSVKDLNHQQQTILNGLYDLAQEDLKNNVKNYIHMVNLGLEDEVFPFSDWIYQYQNTSRQFDLDVEFLDLCLKKIENEEMRINNLTEFFFESMKLSNRNASSYFNYFKKLDYFKNSNLEVLLSSSSRSDFIKVIKNQELVNKEFKPTNFNFAYLDNLILELKNDEVNLKTISNSKIWNIIENSNEEQKKFFKYMSSFKGFQNNGFFSLSNSRVIKTNWDNISKLMSIIKTKEFFNEVSEFLLKNITYSEKEAAKTKLNELEIAWNHKDLQENLKINTKEKPTVLKL